MLGLTGSDNELSWPFAVETLGEAEVVQAFEAGPEAREAVAKRLGLLALEALRAEFRLQRPHDGRLIRCDGRIWAKVTQACVVSLEPVKSELSETFSLVYSPEPQLLEGDLEFTLEDEDLPEEVVDGIIDLGEAAVQQLAVALNPYPRHPDSEIPEALRAEEVTTGETQRPFAALEVLKGGKEG